MAMLTPAEQHYDIIVPKLMERYRGLKKEHIHEVNPEYSCSICANPNCKSVGSHCNCSCIEHEVATLDQFIANYLLKEKT